jgi:hypothetical protein
MILLFIFLVMLVSSTTYADTMLLGHDYYGPPYYEPYCYLVSDSINSSNWKGYRLQASSSGTISYFKVTPFNVPNDCIDDDVIWALYEDNGTVDYAGNLKAYGYVEGYDWTIIGVGSHRFEITDIVTDPIIISGNYYWLVFYAHAIDRDNYSRAGCSSQIFNNRGRSTEVCVSGISSFRQSIAPEYPPAPAGSTFTTSHHSYFDWSVWDEEGGTGPTTSLPLTTTTILSEDTYPPQGNGIVDIYDCEGDFLCDGDVDGSDAFKFKGDFGRSSFQNPCASLNPCYGDFNCDGDSDGTDAIIFREDFGRSSFQYPCPACEMGDWCEYPLSSTTTTSIPSTTTTTTSIPPTTTTTSIPPEICDDTIDNDMDGAIDCNDPDCLVLCGNGRCDPCEDCIGCPEDCAGRQLGKLSDRFCCGDGIPQSAEEDGTICDGNY